MNLKLVIEKTEAFWSMQDLAKELCDDNEATSEQTIERLKGIKFLADKYLYLLTE